MFPIFRRRTAPPAPKATHLERRLASWLAQPDLGNLQLARFELGEPKLMQWPAHPQPVWAALANVEVQPQEGQAFYTVALAAPEPFVFLGMQPDGLTQQQWWQLFVGYAMAISLVGNPFYPHAKVPQAQAQVVTLLEGQGYQAIEVHETLLLENNHAFSATAWRGGLPRLVVGSPADYDEWENTNPLAQRPLYAYLGEKWMLGQEPEPK